MSKRVMATRFPNRNRSVKSVSGSFSNFTLCLQCNRYIPHNDFGWHVSTEHPETVLHISECPKCLSRPYTVKAGEIGGECFNVSACDRCGTIQTPIEYPKG